MFGKRKVAALVAEFVGTFLLSSIVLGMFSRTDFPFFAALTAGLTLAAVTMTIGLASGAHLNPAVTIGMWTLRKIQTTEAIVYIAVQLLGGFVALKLGGWLMSTTFQSAAGKNVDWRVFAAEALGALILGLGVAAVVYRVYDGARAAATVGLSFMLAMLLASLGSNGLANPAVALGINSMNFSYAVGPIVGVVVGMNLYAYLFVEEKSRVKRAVAAVKATTTKKKR